jgi:hypothetical protein
MNNPPDPSRYESWILIAIGGAVIAALLVLVLSNTQLNRTLALPLRLLLAIAAAAVGGALPGAAFRVGFQRSGLVLRAAGAAAFFAVVWLGGPGLLDHILAAPAATLARG